MKPRVFISHSAKEPEAQRLQTALEKALKDSGLFEPLLDRTTLEPGDMWRARINLWVGGCDAAVILLSGKALDSDWVFYEAALLTYRREREPKFLVVPVYVNVNAAAVQASRLHPTEMTAIQAVRGAGRPIQKVVAEVMGKLKETVCCRDSPVKQRAKRLAGLLDPFTENHLRAAAEFIHYDLKPWLPAEDARLLLAVQLQSVGMKAAVPAILHLQENLPASVGKKGGGYWLQKVVDLVASSWVDHRTIERIAPVAKGEVPPCAVGLNAVSPITAKMYVLRSTTEKNPELWKLVECDGIVGQDRIEGIIAELSAKVGRALAAVLKCCPEAVVEVLKMRNAMYPRPIFVSLPAEGISDEILSALRKSFPHIVFFLLMGGAVAGGPLLTDAQLEVLFPHLAQDDEVRFLETYEIFRWSVRPLRKGPYEP